MNFGAKMEMMYDLNFHAKIHTGAKPTFYPEITETLMFEKCEFCEKRDFENVNFLKNEILKM